MNSKFGLFAALLLAAPAIAQEQPATPPQAQNQASSGEQAIQTTAQQFAACITSGVRGLAATVTPEAGASAVLGGCAAPRAQLEQAVEAVIAAMPAEQQTNAREQFRTHMASAEGEIATAIRRARAAPAAPAQ